MANEFWFARPDEEIGSAALITVQSGSGDPDYPPSLLCDFSSGDTEAKPAKMSGTSGAWLLNFGAPRRIDFVVFLHNADAGVALSFQGNASDSWGGPTLSASIVAPAKYENGFTVRGFIDLRTVSGYTTSGFQYWRAVFGTNSVPVGLKILCYSAVHEPDCAFQLGYHEADLEQAIEHETEARRSWVYDLAGFGRMLTGQFPASASDRDSIYAWHRACHGKVKLTSIVVDAAVNNAFVGRWMSSPSVSGSAPSGAGPAILDPVLRPYYTDEFNTIAVGFKELTAGLPEWS